MGNSMFLTTGALMLFGTFLVFANTRMLDNFVIADESEYTLTAVSLAQSIIDEAKTKSFDERSVNTVIASRDSLTPSGFLGPDTNAELIAGTDTMGIAGFRSFQRFDDVDDYHGYTRRVDTPEAEGFILRSTVTYASESNPDSLRSVQTFCKRITVTATSSYLSRQVAVSYVFTY